MSALSAPLPITIPISSPSPNTARGPAWRSVRPSRRMAGRTSFRAAPRESTTASVCSPARPLRCERRSTAPPENSVRWLDVELPEQGFGFAVVHILNAIPGVKEAEGAAKTRFWDALLAAAEARISEPLLLIGDFNTGMPLADETGNTLSVRQPFRAPPGIRLDRRVAVFSWRCQRVHLVFPTEGRRSRQRLPDRSRLRHAQPAAAHQVVPLFPRRAGAEGLRPFGDDHRNQVRPIEVRSPAGRERKSLAAPDRNRWA